MSTTLVRPVAARVHTSAIPLAAILALYLAVAVFEAYRSHLWFDELSTCFVATTRTLHDLWRASLEDGSPPLYFLLARAALHLPVRLELALRLPSIAAYLLAAGAVYRFVLRAVGMPACALLAASIFLGSKTVHFATEARSYALLLFFIGAALCCWQETNGRHRRIALAGVAGSVFAASLTHQYGVLCTMAPVVAGASFQAWRSRRLDLPLLVAGLLGSSAILLTIPPALRAQAMTLHVMRTDPAFFARPGWYSFAGWADLLPPMVPFAIGIAIFAGAIQGSFTRPGMVSEAPRPLPVASLIAASTLTLSFPVILLMTHYSVGYFQPRYGCGSAMGLAMVAGIGLSSLIRRRPLLQPFLPAMTLYFVSMGLLMLYLAPDAIHQPLVARDSLLDAAAGGEEPIVVASALHFSPIWWYADPTLRARLHFLFDLDYAAGEADPLPEFGLVQERAYLPMPLDRYASFLSEHHRFLLYCAGEPRLEWTKERLIRDGWDLELLKSKGNQRMYLVTPSASPQTRRH